MNYGNRIAKLREEKRMTQEELALKIGITRAALSHYENNRREPEYQTLQKIADFFSVSIDFLMGRTSKPQQHLDPAVRGFADSLDLSDEAILEQFDLSIDGEKLTAEETRRFIAFIRAERSMKA
ncbi:helix-turn-helix domain-containing protein [Paenibacillus sp. y28]|uniref:helix-turn-helix domain-containing protein n=1 Tax=Paenibacillus sp. y28 TaxID=3129110 RepID=UPI003019B504